MLPARYNSKYVHAAKNHPNAPQHRNITMQQKNIGMEQVHIGCLETSLGEQHCHCYFQCFTTYAT
jgi:hypothetical protein